MGESKVELATAYVEPEEVVLDPTKLEGSVLENYFKLKWYNRTMD